VCSNTNQAVDQLLLKLCQKMASANEAALKEGSVLRLGQIEHDELRHSFEDLITIDGIIARKSRELTDRKKAIEDELFGMGNAIGYAQRVLARFNALDAAMKELATAQSAFQRKGNATLQAKQAMQQSRFQKQQFERELQNVKSAGVIARFFMRGVESIQQDLRHAESRIVSAEQQLEIQIMPSIKWWSARFQQK
jgi:hypothetical protein